MVPRPPQRRVLLHQFHLQCYRAAMGCAKLWRLVRYVLSHPYPTPLRTWNTNAVCVCQYASGPTPSHSSSGRSTTKAIPRPSVRKSSSTLRSTKPMMARRTRKAEGATFQFLFHLRSRGERNDAALRCSTSPSGEEVCFGQGSLVFHVPCCFLVQRGVMALPVGVLHGFIVIQCLKVLFQESGSFAPAAAMLLDW